MVLESPTQRLVRQASIVLMPAVLGVSRGRFVESLAELRTKLRFEDVGRALPYLETLVSADSSNEGVLSDCDALKRELKGFLGPSVRGGVLERPGRAVLDFVFRTPQVYDHERRSLEEDVRAVVSDRLHVSIEALVNPGWKGSIYDLLARNAANAVGMTPCFYVPAIRSAFVGKMRRPLYVGVLAHEFAHDARLGEEDASAFGVDVMLDFAGREPDAGYRELAVVWAYYSAANELFERTGIDHYQEPVDGEPFALGFQGGRFSIERGLRRRHYAQGAYMRAKELVAHQAL